MTEIPTSLSLPGQPYPDLGAMLRAQFEDQKEDLREIAAQMREQGREQSAQLQKMGLELALLTQRVDSLAGLSPDVRALETKVSDALGRIKTLEDAGTRKTSGLQAWTVWLGALVISILGDLIKHWLRL